MTTTTSQEQAALSATLATDRAEPGALLPVLYDIQRQLGYVSPALASEIAVALKRPLDDVLGAVRSAPGLRTAPAHGPVVQVCLADACAGRGAAVLWAHVLRRAEGEALTPEAVYCLGMCGAGPSVQVNGTLHVGVDPSQLDQLLSAQGCPVPRSPAR